MTVSRPLSSQSSVCVRTVTPSVGEAQDAAASPVHRRVRHASHASKWETPADDSISKCWQPCSISAPAANTAFDHKRGRRNELRVPRRLLEEAGMGSSVAEYLRRLGDLERGRPRPGGAGWQFHSVRLYREAVVRPFAGSGCHGRLPRTMPARKPLWQPTAMSDLNLLFRIVMQCQIIDDVSGLFTRQIGWFAQFSDGLQFAPAGTRADSDGSTGLCRLSRRGPSADVFPLRAGLFLVSVCTRTFVLLGRWRYRAEFGRESQKHADGRGRLPQQALTGLQRQHRHGWVGYGPTPLAANSAERINERGAVSRHFAHRSRSEPDRQWWTAGQAGTKADLRSGSRTVVEACHRDEQAIVRPSARQSRIDLTRA